MIVLTDEKIEVTMQMLERANMTRGEQIGVPVDLADLAKGVRWVDLWKLTDADYGQIEDYFLLKK